MIEYTYKFVNWDEFSVWLKLMGFVRNEVVHGKKGVSGSVVATFQNPNELPQELLRSWAK